MIKRLPIVFSPVSSSTVDLVHLNVTSPACLQNQQTPKYVFDILQDFVQLVVVGTHTQMRKYLG